MLLTSRRSSRRLSTARRTSLLGWYPASDLCMVAARVRPNPRSPLGWQPSPPLQYGIDYTFARLAGRGPVRWPSGLPIVVRITCHSAAGVDQALAIVVGELRELTRLDITVGEPWPDVFHPAAVPKGEIHVGFLPHLATPGSLSPSAGQAGIGVALLKGAGQYYTQGFAAVNAGLIGTNATSQPGLTMLRHELAHVLGLGHSARPSLVMHHRVTASIPGYGRGDRFGLRMLGEAPKSADAPSRTEE